MQQTLNLSTDRLARLDGATCLRVTQGTLWLTIDGDPNDRVLSAGDRIALPPRAQALVQALGAPARLTVERNERGWRPWAAARHAWQAAARRWVLSS